MQGIQRILWPAGLCSLLALVVAQEAQSQESPATAEREKGRTMGEVIVTAQKREESLQDTPVAVTAVTEEQLTRLGADDFSDFARTVPGLAFEELGPSGIRGGLRASMRGVASYGGVAGTFAYYVDETPVPPMNIKLFDVDRVEVLRGPQGTLYGSGAMGGAIKYVTNKPDATRFAAATDTEVTSTEHGGEGYSIDAMGNIPLVENVLAARVVAGYRNLDGYIDRIGRRDTLAPRAEDVNEEETKLGRFMLSYTPTDRVAIDARVIYQDIKVADHGTFDAAIGDFLKARDVDEPADEDLALYNLSLRYDFGPTELFVSSSYVDKHAFESRDITGLTDRVFGPTAGVPIGLPTDITNKGYTHELRLASTGDDRLSWLVGAFYASEDGTLNQLTIDTTLPDPPVANGVLVFLDRESESEELGIFADATWAATEKLKLGAGVRYFDMQQSQVSVNAGLFNGFSTVRTGAEADGFNPRYYASYDITPNHMVYAQAAKGFRPGGGNGPMNMATCAAQLAEIGLTETPPQFDPDSLWSYELGAKTGWFDNRILVNAAIYSIDWTDVQQSIRFPAPCGGGFTGNVGEASSEGYEVELDLMPVENLNLRLAFSSIDAVIETAVPSIGGEVGERILQVPEMTYSASVDYGFDLSHRLRAYVRADYQYVDSRNRNFNQTDLTQTLPDYEFVNARIGVGTDSWEAALFVRNLFDQSPYLNDITDGGVPARKIVTQRPMTVGLNLAYRW